LKTELPIESTLIPASSAVQVVRVNPTKVASGNGWIHFRNNAGTIISCRTWEDVYPDSAKMDMIKGARLILPKVDDALDRAAIFSKMDHILDEEVVINISDNRFKMRATSDDGWFEEELNMKYSGAPIELAITPYLLRGILGETKACQYTENKLKFEGEGWFYITALRNIKPKKK
jgi:DNA polymerase III sliding clamp (beta) subunit (PCNA family)